MSVLRCHGSLELGARWRGSEESSKCISSLASGILKRRAGRGGDVGRHTRAKDCQKRDKKEGEMIKKLPQPPCLPVYLPVQWNQAEQRLEPGECKQL